MRNNQCPQIVDALDDQVKTLYSATHRSTEQHFFLKGFIVNTGIFFVTTCTRLNGPAAFVRAGFSQRDDRTGSTRQRCLGFSQGDQALGLYENHFLPGEGRA